MLKARTPFIAGNGLAGNDAHERLHVTAAGRRVCPLVRSVPSTRALRCAHLVTGIGADMVMGERSVAPRDGNSEMDVEDGKRGKERLRGRSMWVYNYLRSNWLLGARWSFWAARPQPPQAGG